MKFLIVLALSLAPIVCFAQDVGKVSNDSYQPLSPADNAFVNELPKLNAGSELYGLIETVELEDSSTFSVSKATIVGHTEFFHAYFGWDEPTSTSVSNVLRDISKASFVKILRLIYKGEFDIFPADAEGHKDQAYKDEILEKLEAYELKAFIPLVAKQMIDQTVVDQNNLSELCLMIEKVSPEDRASCETKYLNYINSINFRSLGEFIGLHKEYLGDVIDEKSLFFESLGKLRATIRAEHLLGDLYKVDGIPYFTTKK